MKIQIQVQVKIDPSPICDFQMGALFEYASRRQERVLMRELQAASGEELSTLMPSYNRFLSVLDKAFKGEL